LNKPSAVIAIFCVAFFALGCQNEAKPVVKKKKNKIAKPQPVVTQQLAEQVQSQVEAIQKTEERANPFLSEKEEDALKSKEGKVEISYLNVAAIFYAPPYSKAIIEGRVVGEGDILDNKEIIKIEPEEIILKDTQGEYIIQMRAVSTKAS
jgi:mannose/fructose/N-acetylgalactosamine-specific phosphotransferase system component IIB